MGRVWNSDRAVEGLTTSLICTAVESSSPFFRSAIVLQERWRMRSMRRLIFCGLMILICLPALAQQTDINRYTLFTGFDYMISPARNLTERGFESDFGVTVKPWLGLGGDFSAIGSQDLSGAGTINGSETVFAPLLIANENLGAPPPSLVDVPFTSTSYTFAVGPQFYLRKWEMVTLFARPGFGGIHEKANIALPPQLGGLLMLLGA